MGTSESQISEIQNVCHYCGVNPHVYEAGNKLYLSVVPISTEQLSSSRLLYLNGYLSPRIKELYPSAVFIGRVEGYGLSEFLWELGTVFDLLL